MDECTSKVNVDEFVNVKCTSTFIKSKPESTTQAKTNGNKKDHSYSSQHNEGARLMNTFVSFCVELIFTLSVVIKLL